MNNLPATIGERNVFSVMDSLDDKAIIKQLEGQVVNTWVYLLDELGKPPIEGLSKVGIDECCNQLAHMNEIIREESVVCNPDPLDDNFMLFKAQAKRIKFTETGMEMCLETVFGTKRQQRFYANGKENPHWYEQGTMKALRNARSRLIPEIVKAKVMALAKKLKRVHKLTPDDADDTCNIPKGNPCPECGKPLKKRSGKKGDFMGCSGYPNCTHTEKIVKLAAANDDDIFDKNHDRLDNEVHFNDMLKEYFKGRPKAKKTFLETWLDHEDLTEAMENADDKKLQDAIYQLEGLMKANADKAEQGEIPF